ncbi:MAG: carbon dioxide concentrating mechanism protein CcmL [Candidatus Poribacteria bacterium]|nr:MAG: carbon dioxide concentrating mechanism protein CcmL [Candidatus Poribacteria bacterium]
MTLGMVVGTVVATRKDEKLVGGKLLVVQELSMEGKPLDRYAVAVDSVGAGVGEVVLVATGSSARLTAATKDRPVDAVVMAIVDSIEIGGKIVYRK